MSNNLKNVLIEVRKAYRLIYLYQKNIISTIDRFSQEFPCQFYWWTPTKNSPTPQRSTNPTGRWVWDFLPLYSPAFLYISEGGQASDHSPGEWLLSLELITDSEYDPDGAEPNPLNFEKAENSETLLIASFWYCKKAIKENWYYGIWRELDYPEETYDEYESPEGLVCVKKEFALEELEDENLIIKATQNFKQIITTHIPEIDWE